MVLHATEGIGTLVRGKGDKGPRLPVENQTAETRVEESQEPPQVGPVLVVGEPGEHLW
jgi:hypothetical protein